MSRKSWLNSAARALAMPLIAGAFYFISAPEALAQRPGPGPGPGPSAGGSVQQVVAPVQSTPVFTPQVNNVPTRPFTPPIIVPTDVTFDNPQAEEESIPSPESVLGGIHGMSDKDFPGADALKGSTEGINVYKRTPNADYSKPTPYSVDLKSGEVLISVKRPSEVALVTTPIGEIAVTSSSDVLVTFQDGVMRVANADGQHDNVKIRSPILPPGKVISIQPGFEFTAGNHKLSRSDLRPPDGIARRHFKLLEEGKIAVSEFSISSVLSSSELIADMKQNTTGSKEKKIIGDMSRMAAVLNYMNGTQGFVTASVSGKHIGEPAKP